MTNERVVIRAKGLEMEKILEREQGLFHIVRDSLTKVLMFPTRLT